MKYENIESIINIITYGILEDIICKYSLTKTQIMKLSELLYLKRIVTINYKNSNSFIMINTKKNENEEDLINRSINIIIRKIFSLIINPKTYKNDGISDEFKSCIKNGLIELYSLIYCTNENLPYKIRNIESVFYAKELVNGLGKNLANKDIDNIIFKSSIKDLLNLSCNGKKLYLQFENNPYIKKYNIK